MTIVEGLGGDVRNTLHTACDGGTGRAIFIQRLHQALVALPLGVILDHADLLPDDALLLLHRLFGEVGNGHEGEKDLQILIELLRGGEIVAGDGVGSEGVRLSTVGGQHLQGVALLGVEHLMLEVVGDACRGVQPLTIANLKAHVHAAVGSAEQSIRAAEILLGDDADLQAVGQRMAVDTFANAGIGHHHTAASFPLRKNTVSRVQLAAASRIRWGVTACKAARSSSGVSSVSVAF